MNDNKLTWSEAGHGYDLVSKTYLEFKELADEQIKKEGLSEGDFNDVIIGLLITKLLVAEGKLDEKYFKSATS